MRYLPLVVALVPAVMGCDEKKPQLAPVATSLASAPPPTGAAVKKLTIAKDGKATIDMAAPKQKITAYSTASAGTLDVDFANLSASRGEVRVDLATLTMTSWSGADAAENNAAQTRDARTWLEVGDGADGKVDEKVKESNRWAVYSIRSVDVTGPTDVSKIPVVKDGADEVRTATVTTKGDLLIHGHKVEREATVDLAFRYAPGSPFDRPQVMTVKTKPPLRVVLAEHDVKPRDSFGKIAKGSFHLLGTKVADNADIALDFRATP